MGRDDPARHHLIIASGGDCHARAGCAGLRQTESLPGRAGEAARRVSRDAHGDADRGSLRPAPAGDRHGQAPVHAQQSGLPPRERAQPGRRRGPPPGGGYRGGLWRAVHHPGQDHPRLRRAGRGQRRCRRRAPGAEPSGRAPSAAGAAGGNWGKGGFRRALLRPGGHRPGRGPGRGAHRSAPSALLPCGALQARLFGAHAGALCPAGRHPHPPPAGHGGPGLRAGGGGSGRRGPADVQRV